MAAKRKPLSTRKRFEIFKRDTFTCQYCGRRPPQVILHVDHIVPVCEGGTNDLLNLVTSCAECNMGKSSVPLDRVPVNRQAELAKRRELTQQVEALNEFLLESREKLESAATRIGTYLCDKSAPEDEKGCWRPSAERMSSIKTFLQNLPEVEILEAVDIAWSRYPVWSIQQNDSQTWRYFCGICWRKIKGDDRNQGGGR